MSLKNSVADVLGTNTFSSQSNNISIRNYALDVKIVT